MFVIVSLTKKDRKQVYAKPIRTGTSLVGVDTVARFSG